MPASGSVLIDARPRDRFEGAPDPLDPRAGHMPGARSLPCREHLGADGRLLRSRRTARAAGGGRDRARRSGLHLILRLGRHRLSQPAGRRARRAARRTAVPRLVVAVEPGSVAAGRDRPRPVTTAGAELQFRAPVPDDAPAVTALINERERADRGSAEITVEMLVAHWSQPEIELARGRARRGCGRPASSVTRSPLASVSSSRWRPRMKAQASAPSCCAGRWRAVSPAARRLHRQIVGSRNTAAAALLRAAGYERVRSHHRMWMA